MKYDRLGSLPRFLSSGLALIGSRLGTYGFSVLPLEVLGWNYIHHIRGPLVADVNDGPSC